MAKEIKEVYLTLFGNIKETTSAKVHYLLNDSEDPRMGASITVPMWEDDKIKKLSQTLWEHCCEYIQKTEG